MGSLRFVFSRLLGSIPTLLALICLAFFLVRAAPGGPFDFERSLPEEVEANLRAAYSLDDPLPKQLLNYIGDVVRGDFGPSFQYRDYNVTELIMAGFPVSLRLGVAAIIAALFFGSLIGTLAALKQNTKIDYLVMFFGMTGISIPNFVMAPLLILLFSIFLNLLPAGGLGDGGINNMILPITALAFPQVAYIARLTRGSMIEVLGSNFVRTAKAQGIPMKHIVLRHVLKPALLPVVSYLGPATAAIITGSVVVEQIFGLPGLGQYFVKGALNRDYTLVLGVVVFYGCLIILFNLLVDILYGFIDPKIKTNR
ncbi:MAG: oligopeptide ABC transporter permease OppB [Gammaproteobacteria bacterium]|nr:oligopeptide ABC transporter permease OppB [Gammaproteobacteria bacterium]